jgi:tetratricopeptide (TPR) repeat protein
VRARAELAQGKFKPAIHRLERATALQDQMFYSEPSYWYFPVRQMLGAALLMDGQAHRAESVFIRALVDAPNNAWALYGLREAQVAMGNEAAANYADTLFRQAWLGDADALRLEAL